LTSGKAEPEFRFREGHFMEQKIKIPPTRLSREGRINSRATALGLKTIHLAELSAGVSGANKSSLYVSLTDKDFPLPAAVADHIEQTLNELEELNAAVQQSVRRVAGDASQVTIDWGRTEQISNALLARRAARILVQEGDHSLDAVAETATKELAK
jgi:hypothetical protein